jgi:hypothetical protein
MYRFWGVGMPRTADRNERLAKRCNNTCPICWMPLHVGDRGAQADNWRVVQLTFKAKPAFSVKHNSEDFSRPVLVFGTNDFTGVRQMNYDGCHYVHYSLVGDGRHFSGLWEVGNSGPHMSHGTANIVDCEPTLKDAFYVALFSSQHNLFELVFGPATSTTALLDGIYAMGDSILGPLAHLHLFVKEFFMGCADCNQKMTISEFIGPLFSLLFSEDTYTPSPKSRRKKRVQEVADDLDTTLEQGKKRSPKADGFTDEMMLHYIMLRGLLKVDDEDKSRGGGDTRQKYFKVSDPRRLRAWLLKCIMMWCSLQILFCSWKMAALFDGKRHHTNYIYRGVIDFYLSLWFYALYMVCAHDRPAVLYFDEFHYYYTSMMPFYFHQRDGFNGPFNLCSIVLAEQNFGQNGYPYDSIDPHSDVQTELEIMFNRVTRFWTDEMSTICFGIHALQRPGIDHHLPPFFTPLDSVELLRQRVMENTRNLDAQSFCDALTPFWYWFHFRHITMRVISETSREYLQKQGMPMPAKVLWYDWCRRFDTRVAQLGVRMLMQQKKELIRLRTLIGHNSNQSGTSLRRLDSRSPPSLPPPLPRFGADAVAPSSTSESRTA